MGPASGNGPVTLTLPRPGDAGVTTRSLPDFETTPRKDAAAAEPETAPAKGKVLGVPVEGAPPAYVAGNGH